MLRLLVGIERGGAGGEREVCETDSCTSCLLRPSWRQWEETGAAFISAFLPLLTLSPRPPSVPLLSPHLLLINCIELRKSSCSRLGPVLFGRHGFSAGTDSEAAIANKCWDRQLLS